MKYNITVIGAGSWGSSLALVLNDNGHKVSLYMRRKEQLDEIKYNHTNQKYLKDVFFPENINYTDDLKKCVKDSEILILAVTTQLTRKYLELIKPYLKNDTILVNVSKGIELTSHLRASEIYAQIIKSNNFAVLSGPSHAEEVSKKMPTTVVAASLDIEIAKKIQYIFSNDYFRVYTNTDVIGVELGGAVKNIIALGSGICDAIGYGDNTKAGIITRGIHEITRLGVKLGAKAETFSGLSGIGDLIVTCTSNHSRNKRAGQYIANGLSINEIQEKIGMAIEGINTTLAVYEISKVNGVSMPITEAIYEVIYDSKDIKETVRQIMNRDKKNELITEDKFINN